MKPRGSRSALVVPVPDADRAISAWREKFDRSAALGMPTHITLLYPFAPADGLSEGVIASLKEWAANAPSFDVTFRRTAQFPRVLYLEPEPGDALVALTHTLVERWPESPPYGGAFEQVIPHLTVAVDADEVVLREVGDALRQQLPFTARISEGQLYTFDAGRWSMLERLPFRS